MGSRPKQGFARVSLHITRRPSPSPQRAAFPPPQLPHSHTSRHCRATSLSCCSAGRPLLSCGRGGRCATRVLASLSEISGHNAYHHSPRPPPTAAGAPRSRRSHLPNGPTWDTTTIPCHPLQGTLCEHQEIKNFAPGTRCHHYWKEAPSSCHRCAPTSAPQPPPHVSSQRDPSQPRVTDPPAAAARANSFAGAGHWPRINLILTLFRLQAYI